MFRLRNYLATDELDIFLSHAHFDHVVGLTFLLGVLYDKSMRRVTVHGEAEKLAAVREHLFHRRSFPWRRVRNAPAYGRSRSPAAAR